MVWIFQLCSYSKFIFSSSALPFCINFRINLSKIMQWFDWNCIKAIDQFRKISIWYLNHIESLSHNLGLSYHLLGLPWLCYQHFHYIDFACISLDSFRAVIKGIIFYIGLLFFTGRYGKQNYKILSTTLEYSLYLYNFPTCECGRELCIWYDCHFCYMSQPTLRKVEYAWKGWHNHLYP